MLELNFLNDKIKVLFTIIILETNAIEGASHEEEHATNAFFSCCVDSGSKLNGFDSEDISFSALVSVMSDGLGNFSQTIP